MYPKGNGGNFERQVLLRGVPCQLLSLTGVKIFGEITYWFVGAIRFNLAKYSTYVTVASIGRENERLIDLGLD